SHGCVRISPENAATLYALVEKNGLKNTEVVLTGVTPGGEYKVARQAAPRHGQAVRGWYESNNYYAQPQWGGGFFGHSSAAPITMDLRATTERHHRADFEG
ncbi:MAG: L,D-transpeptidase, partial [Pseudolabrys sp.]